MRSRIKFLCCLVALVVLPAVDWPQTVILPAERITSDSGMVAEWVFSMHQDRLGFMWFGTNLGVVRHDGHHFRVFRRANTLPAPLSNDYVLALAEDGAGDIWLGTADGLNRFHPPSETFSVFRHDAGDPGSLAGNIINHLAVWRARPGFMWVSTADGGLNCFNLKTGRCKRFRPGASRPGSEVRKVWEDSSSRVWVAAGDGFYRLDPEAGSFEAFRHDAKNTNTISSDSVFEIFESKSHPGILWVGTGRNGLNRFDPGRRSWERFTLPAADLPDPLANVVYFITQYPADADSLLVGTWQGLFKFDMLRHTWLRLLLQDQFRENGDQSNEIVHVIFQDRSGVCWIGIQGRGLFKFIPQQLLFRSHVNPGRTGDSGQRYPIGGMAEDRSGRIWLGTYGGGLFRYSPDPGSHEHFPLAASRPDRARFQTVRVLCHTRQDELWAATNGGLVRLQTATGEQEIFPADAEDPASLGFTGVASICEDSQGDVWIGSDFCLLRWERHRRSFKRYLAAAADPGSLSSSHVNPILEDRAGNVWVGTENGLNLYDRGRDRFRRYFLDPPDADKETQNYVMALHQDRRGRIWVGTSNGVNLMEFQGEKIRFRHFSSPGSTVRNFVLGMVGDDEDNLWISSSGGLSRFDMNTLTFSHYDGRDRVPPVQFIYGCCLRSRSGELFFGGVRDFFSFKPWLARFGRSVPPMAFVDFQIHRRQVAIGGASPLKNAINLTQGLVLSHDRNNLTLSFASLSFIRPEKHQYAYRLDGRDDSWNELGFEHSVTLDNLKPGRYRLRVRGANHEGVWNEAGISLDLHIRPPFWQAWWFRALLALMALVLFSEWNRTRARRLAARIRTEAAMDLYCDRLDISPRQKEIIRLLLRGKSNKEIEDALFISMGTVKTHIYRIFRKLEVKNRSQLITLFKNLRIK